MSIYRSEVLSLYRRIFRLGRKWTTTKKSTEPAESEKEQQYIYNEARRLFRKNKDETSEDLIKQHIAEAETRLGLTEHYGTPYPRLMNIPQNVMAPHGVSKFKKAQRRAIDQATPIYLKSYKDENFPDR